MKCGVVIIVLSFCDLRETDSLYELWNNSMKPTNYNRQHPYEAQGRRGWMMKSLWRWYWRKRKRNELAVRDMMSPSV